MEPKISQQLKNALKLIPVWLEKVSHEEAATFWDEAWNPGEDRSYGWVQSLNIWVGFHPLCRLHKQGVHPGRLTWNLQMTHLERKMIFQTSMIVFHVNLPGCNAYCSHGFCYKEFHPAGAGPSGCKVMKLSTVWVILLMGEFLHQLIGRLSHYYFQGFLHPRGCRISSLNSIIWGIHSMPIKKKKHFGELLWS